MTNSFMKNVVLAAGKTTAPDFGVMALPSVMKQTLGGVSASLKSIPANGPALPNKDEAGLIVSIDAILASHRVDKTRYELLKGRVKNADKPVEMAHLITEIPSAGSGAEGIIAVANAIAKGPPLGTAVLKAIRSELASGGRQGFEQAYTCLTDGECNDEKVSKVVHAVWNTATGKQNGVTFDAFLAKLTSAQQRGVKVGLIFGLAQRIQKAIRRGVTDSLPLLHRVGEKVKEKNAVTKLASQELRFLPGVQAGFLKTIGLLHHKATPVAIESAREAMSPDERKGFDVAAALKVGQVSSPIPFDGTPRAQLGYYVAKGTEGMNSGSRKEVLAKIKNPETTKGVRKGLSEVTVSPVRKIFNVLVSWFKKKV